MEAKGGKKNSSSSKSFYEAPLGYGIEDVRPHGGIRKFRSAAYSNVSSIIEMTLMDMLATSVNRFHHLTSLFSTCSACECHPDFPP